MTPTALEVEGAVSLDVGGVTGGGAERVASDFVDNCRIGVGRSVGRRGGGGGGVGGVGTTLDVGSTAVGAVVTAVGVAAVIET